MRVLHRPRPGGARTDPRHAESARKVLVVLTLRAHVDRCGGAIGAPGDITKVPVGHRSAVRVRHTRLVVVRSPDRAVHVAIWAAILRLNLPSIGVAVATITGDEGAGG